MHVKTSVDRIWQKLALIRKLAQTAIKKPCPTESAAHVAIMVAALSSGPKVQNKQSIAYHWLGSHGGGHPRFGFGKGHR